MSNPISVYVDETYLDDRSGVIQSAFCLPKKNLSNFESAVDALKPLYPGIFPAIEFKGSSLSHGNLPVYREFLNIVCGFSTQISDKSPLRTIITIESKSRLEDKNFDWILNQLKSASSALNVTAKNLDHFLTESARQIWWIYRFSDKFCTSPIANEFIFVFDNKQQYGQMCRSDFDLIHPQLGPVKWNGGKLISSYAKTLLNALGKREGKAIPKVDSFDFGFSTTTRPLQACDLLSNLFFNTLKGELGFASPIVSLKHSLFAGLGSGPLPNALYVDLDVATANGQDLLIATGNRFGGCIQLE